MVAGAAALIVSAFETRGLLDEDPGLDGPIFSAAPVIKSLLMNTANINTYIGGSSAAGGSGFLAPITLQGAGRVDVLKAFQTTTIAWDVTDFVGYLEAFPDVDPPCSVFPVTDVLLFSVLGIPPDCAADFPFGNDLLQRLERPDRQPVVRLRRRLRLQQRDPHDLYPEPGRQQPYVQFQPVVPLRRRQEQRRIGQLLAVFAHAADRRSGVCRRDTQGQRATGCAIGHWTPGSTATPAPTFTAATPTTSRAARRSRSSSTTASSRSTAAPETACACRGRSCPRRRPRPTSRATARQSVRLRNPAQYKAGDTDVLALVDLSPNNCEVVDDEGNCVEENYIPGILPGINQTAIDIKESRPALLCRAGLECRARPPAAPSGAVDDEVLEFGLTVYDAPYRASHNYPVEFDTYVDSNTDGTDDYVVFNADDFDRRRRPQRRVRRRRQPGRRHTPAAAVLLQLHRLQLAELDFAGACCRLSVCAATGRSSSSRSPSTRTSPAICGTARRSTAANIISSRPAC